MGKLGKIAKNAETPTGQEMDLLDPVSWGQLVVGTAAFAASVAGGFFLYNEAKSATGAQDVNNPLNSVLGEV